VSNIGAQLVHSLDKSQTVCVDVISSTDDHVSLLQSIFDFDSIRALIRRPDFSFRYDCMHGVQGPYAVRVFVDELGADSSSLLNSVPKEDFSGCHADPNLTYAHDLCAIMGVNR
jgi:phosphoglucomutase